MHAVLPPRRTPVQFSVMILFQWCSCSFLREQRQQTLFTRVKLDSHSILWTHLKHGLPHQQYLQLTFRCYMCSFELFSKTCGVEAIGVTAAVGGSISCRSAALSSRVDCLLREVCCFLQFISIVFNVSFDTLLSWFSLFVISSKCECFYNRHAEVHKGLYIFENVSLFSY